MMSNLEKVMNIVHKNGGFVTTREVREACINTTVLSRMVKEHKLERVSVGFYSLPNSFGDDYYKVQLKCKNAVFSHATALYFYDLSDRTPLILDITVASGYNGPLRKMKNVELHYVKKEVLGLGITEILSPFGMRIKVYDIERTICDIVKNKNKMEREVFVKALQSYSKLKIKDLNKLMRYAKVMKIEKKVREYMEVLI